MDEKKSELREGAGGDASLPEEGTATREGGVNHEIGESKMSFLLRPFGGELISVSCSNAGVARTVETRTGLRGGDAEPPSGFAA